MGDGLCEAASEMIFNINQRMGGIGLQTLLQVPTINEMYGRFGGADFYSSAISVLKGLIEVANVRGLTPIVQEHTARLTFAQSMLERELQRTPIPTTPLDADSKTWHNPEGGASYVVVGSGHPDGYAVELREEGENRVVKL